jgi:hypothetical protein
VNQKIREILEIKIGEDLKLLLRFVDDYWCATDKSIEATVIKDIFNENGQGLEFTLELEEDGIGLQFLETRTSTTNGLCWECKQRAPKPLLPWNSSHAREIKQSIVINELKSVVNRSCPCHMSSSLSYQEDRFHMAGYPDDFVQTQKIKTLKNWNRNKNESQDGDRIKYVGIQRYHKVTHAIEKAARKRGIKVVSKYRLKNRNIIYMKNTIKRITQQQCTKHAKLPFECASKVVYSIMFSCRKKYIGQTIRCVNERYSEHESGSALYSSYNKHRSQCKCKVKQCEVINEKPITSTHVRMMLETFTMEKIVKNTGKDSLVSNPSIHPSVLEREFITTKTQWGREK